MDEENRIQLYEPAPAKLEPRPAERPRPYEMAETEEEPDLRHYWRVVLKRRWTILTILLGIFTVALIATLRAKPVYRANALLEIEKENPNILTVQELFQLETVSDNYLETQYKVLGSDSLARRVVRELHLDQAKEFNPLAGPWGGKEEKEAGSKASGADSDEQMVLRRFADRLSIDPVRHSRLVAVSFESEDPQLAARVVNALAANYIEGNLEVRWEAAQKASEWLAQQLQGVKARLEKSEDELQKYAQDNGLLYLESEQGRAENIVDERLRQLQDELTKAQADRYGKESLYRLVQAGDYGSLPGVFDNRLMQELTVRLSELERAQAELTPTFSDDYPKVRQLQSQIDKAQKLLDRERQRAAQRIANDYLAAIRREALVRQAFEEQQKQANRVAGRSVQYNILKREVDTNKQLYEGLLQRLKEAGISAGLKASNIRIVDAAVPPTRPVKPRILINLALGLVLGLACGVGAAFLQENLDNTMKTPEDVERFLRVPALALIPSRESLERRLNGVYGQGQRRPLVEAGNGRADLMVRGWVRIDGNGAGPSALSEAFRSLRTSVLLSTAERPPQSLVILSAQPGEGKTTIAGNLAISLAQLGKRVLLIDGDMRRPCVHKLFDIRESLGLVSYLTGQQDWRALVRPAAPTSLDCLVCGPVPPNPAELLSSEPMHALIREAVGEYHFVLVDSPPLLSVADGRILAAMVEGAVLVVRGATTPRELVQRAQFYVRGAGAHLIGVVLNNVDLRRDGYYYYSYYRYRDYGATDDARQKG